MREIHDVLECLHWSPCPCFQAATTLHATTRQPLSALPLLLLQPCLNFKHTCQDLLERVWQCGQAGLPSSKFSFDNILFAASLVCFFCSSGRWRGAASRTRRRMPTRMCPRLGRGFLAMIVAGGISSHRLQMHTFLSLRRPGRQQAVQCCTTPKLPRSRLRRS